MYRIQAEDRMTIGSLAKYGVHPVAVGVEAEQVIVELKGDGKNWEASLRWSEWDRLVAWVEWKRLDIQARSN